MATIASILVDGQDPSMPALRAWLQGLNISVSAAISGLRTFTSDADLNAYTPTGTEPRYAFVANGETFQAYRFTGALPWVADDSYYQGAAAVVQPLVDRAEMAAVAAEAGLPGVTGRLDAVEIDLQGRTGGGGVYPATAFDFNINDGLTTLSNTPFPTDDSIEGAVVSAPAGPATLYIVTVADGEIATVRDYVDVLLTGDEDTVYPWAVTPNVGEYLAVYTQANGPSIGAQAGTATAYVTGRPTAGDALEMVGGYRVSIGWKYAGGLKSEVAALAARVAGLQTTTTPRKFRSTVSRLIGTKSPLVFLTDSLGEGEFRPSSLDASYINLIADFANADYAPNTEPGCTIVVGNADPVATPSWFGLTVVGATSVNVGSLGRAAQIAVGGYIEFGINTEDYVSAFSEAEVFYEQMAGGGTLTRTVNGASPQTISAAGIAASDKLTEFGEASGTVRFTVTGAPVIITGVHRIGPKPSAGASEPLRVQRHGFGGYGTASFTNARLDAIIRQAKALGPTPEYTIALMTNDWAFGEGLANFATNSARMLAYLAANGSPSRINWLSPTRPGAGGNVIPAGATDATFDTFVSAIQAACDANGAHHLALSETDWSDVAGAFDGDRLHWRDPINAAVATRFIDWRSA